MNIYTEYAVAWIGLAALAIANGAVREKIYGPLMSELHAHQLSTAVGIALFGAYMWAVMGIWELASARQALSIGCVWLIMTILFEFVFGHYVMGHPWDRLLQDYNLLKGRVWVLVLIWTTLGPCIIYRIRA